MLPVIRRCFDTLYTAYYELHMPGKKFIRSAPYLPVKNLSPTLDYYRNGLGFYEEWTFGETEGGIRREEMRLLFGEHHEFAETILSKEQRIPLLWFVEDIDGVHEEFRNRNIDIVCKLQTQPYIMREFAFIDINDYYILAAEGFE